MVDGFIALQVRGIDRVIEGLERFIQKAKDAANSPGLKAIADQAIATDAAVAQDVQTRFGTSSSGSGAGSVDASIRPLIEAAAAQYQVDKELLARLQLAENAKPSGVDAGGNAMWARSPTGAIGPMQVTGSTFAGLPGFAGQDINNPQTNINAGTSLFAHLLEKYKDPYLAVLAYHDGETLIDHVMNGDRNAQGFSYQASIEGRQEAERVTGGYTGPGLLRAAGAGQAAANDTAITVSGARSSSALPDSVQRLLGSGNDGTQFSTAQDANDQIEKVTRAILDLRASGETTGPTMDRLQALLGKAREAAYGAVTPFQALTRASQDQLGPLQAESGAARTVAEAVSQATVALHAHGQDITSAEADQVRADALTKLGLAFNDNVASINRQIAAQQSINAVYAQSGGNILDVTAKTKAEADARATAIPGTQAYSDQVATLTDRYRKLAQGQLALQQIQQNTGLENNIAYIQKETDTLGMNEDARTRLLAVMKAEQEEHTKYGAILPAEAQRYTELVGAQADYTASLKQQQGALAEVSNFFSGTFDTISSAITQAFATGQLQALKFADVMRSVASSVISEFAKLAVLNPLKNLLFGTSDQTLSTVFGNLFGNGVGSTATASGASALGALGLFTSGKVASTATANSNSTSGTLDAASSLGRLIFGKGTDSAVGGLTNWIVGQVAGAVTASATTVGAGLGAVGGAGIDVASSVGATASQVATTTTLTQAAGAVTKAIPYIGVAISLLTDIATGNYRGAGLVAGGATVGAIAGSFIPAIGTAAGAAVGAAIGGLVDALFPQHAKNPYANVAVDVAGGQVVAGKQVSQLEDGEALQKSVQSYADGLNKFMDSVGIQLSNANGTIANIGDHITGLQQYSDFSGFFNKFSFADKPDDSSQFGVAKGALAGMSFDTPQALADMLQKIAGFSDATEALGIKLAAVGTNLTQIRIASVDQVGDPTTTVTNAQGQKISYQSNLSTALGRDLPGQSFGDVSALDAEIAKVNDFVNGLIPQLLTPVKKTSSTLVDQITALEKQYNDAIAQSIAYGLDNTQALADAKVQAVEILRHSAEMAVAATETSITGRGQDLRYGYAGTVQSAGGFTDASGRFYAGVAPFTAGANGRFVEGGTDVGKTATASANLLVQQQNELAQFEDQWRQTWGDAIVSTQMYQSALRDLIDTQAEETQVASRQAQEAKDSSWSALTKTLADAATTIGTNAGVDTVGLALQAFDAQAAVAKDAFAQQWADYFGEASLASAKYQQYAAVIDAASYRQRLDLQDSFNDQSAAQIKTAQGNVVSLFGSIKSYVAQLATSDASPLSPLAQYAYEKGQFNTISSAATAGDFEAASQLTSVSEAFLKASRAVYDSGVGYADDYNRVTEALQNVVANPEGLTTSDAWQISREQTAVLKDSIASLQDEVRALRRAVQNQTTFIVQNAA